MNKRDTVLALVGLGTGAIAAPLASFAQTQGKVWRIGVLSTRGRPDSLESSVFGAFLLGMRELGYSEGKNLIIEWRFADGHYDRFPGLVADLVRLKVDAIVATGSPSISAAQRSTATIPIVMVDVSDPVGSGFVKSLAHPAGNLTGLSNISVDISPKLLELLVTVAPNLTRVAVLVNFGNPSHAPILKSAQAAARRVKLEVLQMEARTPQGIEKAFAAMAQEKVGAFIVPRDGLFIRHARQIAELAAKNRLPSISMILEYVEAGGLMGYGTSDMDIYRRAATYVDKILKGANPGDLPVEQPTKLELIINRKVAKALGLAIPQSILLRTDRVIE